MLLASTNCVGAVWWECIIILAPLLFSRNRIRYEREGRFRAINVILHRGCAPIGALKRCILVVVQDRDFLFHGSTQMSLSPGPLIGECHWRPGIATPLLAKATQALI